MPTRLSLILAVSLALATSQLYGETVINGAPYELATGSTLIDTQLSVGNGATGTVQQTGGDATLTDLLSVGVTSNSVTGSGYYYLSAGKLDTARTTLGGSGSVGVFSQSGGNHSTAELLLNGRSSYALNAGQLNSTRALLRDTAIFSQTGGSHDIAGELSLGWDTRYQVDGGNLNVASMSGGGQLRMSTGTIHSAGTVNLRRTSISGGDISTGRTDIYERYEQTNGSAYFKDYLQLRNWNGAANTHTLSGGLLHTGGTRVGDYWYAKPTTLEQSGGMHQVDGELFVNGTGHYLLSNGTLNTTSSRVEGNFEQTGGQHLTSGALTLSNGHYVLNGGQLRASQLSGTGDLQLMTGELISQGAVSLLRLSVSGGSLYASSADVSGEFHQSAGITTLNDTLQLRRGDNNSATNTLSGGLLGTHNTRIGDYYYGLPTTLIQSAGEHEVAGSLSLNGVGQYQLLGGKLTSSTTQMEGQFDQRGGQHATGQLAIAEGGHYLLAGGRLSATRISAGDSTHFEMSGGELSVRDFEGSLNNQGGQLDATGLHITGNYIQGATADMNLFWQDGESAPVTIDGGASLSGKLHLNLATGLLTSLPNSITLLSAGSLLGHFDEFIAPILAGYTFSLDYGGNGVSLRVQQMNQAPLPGAWAFMASGLGLLGATRRRARS